jgi:hypothetical protein
MIKLLCVVAIGNANERCSSSSHTVVMFAVGQGVLDPISEVAELSCTKPMILSTSAGGPSHERRHLIQTPRCTLTYNLMYRPLLQLIEDNSCKLPKGFDSPSVADSMGTAAHAVTVSQH